MFQAPYDISPNRVPVCKTICENAEHKLPAIIGRAILSNNMILPKNKPRIAAIKPTANPIMTANKTSALPLYMAASQSCDQIYIIFSILSRFYNNSTKLEIGTAVFLVFLFFNLLMVCERKIVAVLAFYSDPIWQRQVIGGFAVKKMNARLEKSQAFIVCDTGIFLAVKNCLAKPAFLLARRGSPHFRSNYACLYEFIERSHPIICIVDLYRGELIVHIDYNLGEVVKNVRKINKLTQDQLAEKLGVGSRHIMAIENEGKLPSYELLYKMIRILNIPADSVFRPETVTRTMEQEQFITEFLSSDEQKQRVVVPCWINTSFSGQGKRWLRTAVFSIQHQISRFRCFLQRTSQCKLLHRPAHYLSEFRRQAKKHSHHPLIQGALPNHCRI